MGELSKKIIGNWVDIRGVASNFYKITEYFQFNYQRLSSILSNLKFSSEQGIIEYKRTMLSPIFRLLDTLQYKSVSLDIFLKHGNTIEEIIFIILIQRLFARGTIKFSEKFNIDELISADNIEIDAILKDILTRITKRPELKNNLAIKNILIQFTIYTNEKKTMEKLSANIKSHASNSFYENFKTTFNRIYSSIRKNYEIILKEDASKIMKKNILNLVSLKGVSSILYNQAKDFSRIKTTFDFVKTEKYKIRENLLPIFRKKDNFLGLITNELDLYNELGKTLEDVNGDLIALSFCNELSIFITKYIKKTFNVEKENN